MSARLILLAFDAVARGRANALSQSDTPTAAESTLSIN